MSNRTVYMVTAGEYSDYRVRGIFSTLEKAQAAIAMEPKHNGDDMEIEPMHLDPLERRPKSYLTYAVRMNKDGNVTNCYKVSVFSEPYMFYSGGALSCTIYARNDAHAVKIVAERRAIIVANDEWGDPQALKARFEKCGAE